MVRLIIAQREGHVVDLPSLAWVMGASDPSSGTASIHEVVRGLGELLRNGCVVTIQSAC